MEEVRSPELFKIVSRITVNDNHIENSQSRDVLIVECLGERVAFYKSTGTSNSTSWSKNTYFPFYGIKRFLKEPNHFIKASEIKTGGYFYVPEWKTILKNAPYFVPRELLNYFDSFVELQASAWLNSGWWLSIIGERNHALMLKMTWNDENQTYQELDEGIPTLDGNQLAGIKSELNFFLDVDGVGDEINDFLLRNNAKNRIVSEIAVDRAETQPDIVDDQNSAKMFDPEDSSPTKKSKRFEGGKKKKRTKRKITRKKIKTIKKKTMTNRKSRRH